MAVFRAVETGRPVIRAANTGFSAFIGPQGHIISQSGLFREDILTHKLRLDDSPPRFYTRYGDLFAIALLFTSLFRILQLLWYNKQKRPFT
jgi:apolipoprotein N-acyltransferase